jgi:hypothetical protein
LPGHGGVDLIFDALPFARLQYGEPNAISKAADYANFFSRSHDVVIEAQSHQQLQLMSQVRPFA